MESAHRYFRIGAPLILEWTHQSTGICSLQSFIEGDARGVQMPIVINPKLEEKLEREKEDAEQKLADAKNRIDRDSFSEQRNGTLRKLSLCRFLNRYAASAAR